MWAEPLAGLPDLVEEVHEGVVDHEGDGDVEAHATEPRNGALVEGRETLVPGNLEHAVEGVLVLVSVKTLHACFDHVDGGVAEDGGGACDGAEHADDELVDGLGGVPAAVPVLAGLHDEEPDGLVAALLHDGRRQPLIRALDAFSADNLPHPVEEALVLGVCRGLVVDELDLDRLHGGDGQDGLRDARTQTTQEAHLRGQVAPGVHAPLLQGLKRTEPDSRLGDRSVDEHAEPPVEALDAVGAHCLTHHVGDAVVARLGRPLVQLQLRLHILRREGDADLDAARDATGDDSFGGFLRR